MKSRKETPYLDLFQIIGLKLKKRADESIKELGLNAQQGKVIDYLYENQNKNIIQMDLADRFHLSRASITSMLQGLEQKGFIERKIPANNERQKNIYVLPKAVELIEDFQDSFQKVEEEIVQVLTDEEKQVLKKLLIKINETV
ncbi:MarR family transcriptional regulator [Paenibacillus sp. UMB7766-LJ446]|uniref:MarR family winged helix-turn-helix transcriptional regulator n=1 Tax=unclassified Paenibacillus TaxID=185978 RepID=UPI000465DACF|nr:MULTISPECIES: MarR family transcriptional regulator [unclassified Paenibacillus]KGP78887.1 MarR family transcriptional regulator [Paenibacillus sp. MAEPY2]KGP88633.1 MarR family transcriptional regulator [Paenibacillus sp. MAEPY1]MDK8189765.1 MarR family transcriptional regulator [Paenibacillus sp. UMB7766-LJ446]OPG95644.1 MarR family transcriptional regulator [Chryseobacterium mucoviscidosis]